MGLTLVTGRANSGKTGVIYDALKATADTDQRPSLLLPSYPDVARAAAELSRTHPLGMHVEQFDRWVGEQWSLCGDGRTLVTSEQRMWAVADAIAGCRLDALAPSSTTPGFARLVSYVAQRASEEPRARLDAGGARSTGDAEMVLLLKACRERLDAAGLIEPGEAALLFSLDPPAGGPVFIHRFTDLGRAQEALVTALATVRDVWVSLPWEQDFPATEALDGLVGRLSALGAHRHCPTPENEDELARFEAGMFRSPEPGPVAGAVAFCTAAGEEAESALVAERARAAALRFGPDRVAIVFKDAGRHVERLRTALAGAGVAADFDVLVAAGKTPFGAALSRLMAAVSGSGRTDVLAFLRSPFAGIDAAAVDDLDARWRALPGGDAARSRSDASRIGPGPGRALKLAGRVSAAPLSAASLKDWKELADSLFASAHTADSLREDPDAFVDAAAHRALLETVTRLVEVGAGRLGASDVLAALDEVRISPTTAEQPGHVQVTEARRLRSRRFDAVIVGGLTAGEFSAEGRSDVAAQTADRILGTTRPVEQARERLLFYDVCTRARRELVLVRQTADSEGTPKRPSVFWEEALDLYRAPDADASGEDEAGLLADTVQLSDLDRAAPALTPGRARLRSQAASGDVRCGEPHVVDAIRRAGARRGEIGDAETLALLAAREEFSATELETYARCPYRWFYERAVRPGALDVGLDARAHGSLAHRTLAEFYTVLPERLGEPRVTSRIAGAALDLAGSVFDEMAAAPGVPAAMTLAEQDDLARTRRRVLDLVAGDETFLVGLAPERVELRFGTPDPAHPDPSSAGAVDLGGFLLRGSIDRLDKGDAGLAVIDYKSGEVPKGADLVPERHLQVGLYAAVARQVMGQPVVAGLYRSLKSGAARGFWVKGEVAEDGLTSTDAVPDAGAVAQIIDESVRLARDAADGIRAGAITAMPASAKACDYCPAGGFCGGRC